MKNDADVLIVGRPNVGKSSFANRLSQTKEAITAEVAGVTRDLKPFSCEWIGYTFTILDSGGMVLEKEITEIQRKIDVSVQERLKQIPVILFVVDVMQGLHPIDQNIAKLLRMVSKNVVLVANKVDNQTLRLELSEFTRLGFGDPFGISALHGTGVGDVLDVVVEKLKLANRLGLREDEIVKEDDELDEVKQESFNVIDDERDLKKPLVFSKIPTITVVGRPNIGKSSLINCLAREKRVLVHNEAGTTRDSIAAGAKLQQEDVLLVDTAGLRRRTKVVDPIEYYSRLRTDRALDEADLVIWILDATELMTELDKKIFQQLREKGKNVLLFINKCDLIEDLAFFKKEQLAYLCARMRVLEFYPFVFGSAVTKKGINDLVTSSLALLKRAREPITTGKLNRILGSIVTKKPPPAKKGKRLRIMYATQISLNPFSILVFVNEPGLVSEPYYRFLERQFREITDNLYGVGLNFKFTGRREKESD